MTAHARCGNETAVGVIFKFLPIDIRPLLLLPSPVDTGSSGAIKRAVQVRRDNPSIVFDSTVKRGALSPRYTGICDEDI